DQATHGMAEDDHRQAGMLICDQIVDSKNIGEHFFDAVLVREHAGRRIRCPRAAVAAMVVRIDMEAMCSEMVGKALVARGVLGKAMVDLHNSARWFGGLLHKNVQRRTGRRIQDAPVVESHPYRSLIPTETARTAATLPRSLVYAFRPRHCRSMSISG